MTRRPPPPTPQERAGAIIAFLNDAFSGTDIVPGDARLPDGWPLMEAVYSVTAKERANPGTLDDAVSDVIVTAACIFENNFPALRAGDYTERHGTVREAIAAMGDAGPTAPRGPQPA